jgi:hypothetical protein
VEIVNVLSNNFTLEILPGTGPDAIARINGRLPIGGLRAQIGTPGFAPSTRALSQFLAIPVCTLDAAQIGTLARARARDEKRHVRRLWCLLLRLRLNQGALESMAADIIKLKRVALFIENLPRWFMFFRVLSDASWHAATVASFWIARPQSHFQHYTQQVGQLHIPPLLKDKRSLVRFGRDPGQKGPVIPPTEVPLFSRRQPTLVCGAAGVLKRLRFTTQNIFS